MSRKEDLDFLCNCSVTVEHLFLAPHRSWMIGTRTNLQNGSWYDRRRRSLDTMRLNMFKGTEDDQDERHDHSTKSREIQTRNEEETLSHVKQNLTEEHTTEIYSVRHTSRA